MKVFLVEDSTLLRGRLATLLASVAGAVTVGHADGVQEALTGIQAAGPDVVVLDLHLKDGNGLSVLKSLQQSAPQIAVFVLTNYPEESYRRMAERYGARGFFDKSHDISRLREALAGLARGPARS